MKKEVTLLKTWKDEEYKLDMSIQDYIGMKMKTLQEWWDWFFSSKYNEFLKFSRFESEKGKTDYIYLEWPKDVKEKRELTPQERIQLKKNIAEAMERSKERRFREFLEERNNILKKLAEREKEFWTETTIEKLNEYEELRVEKMRNNLIDNLELWQGTIEFADMEIVIE